MKEKIELGEYLGYDLEVNLWGNLWYDFGVNPIENLWDNLWINLGDNLHGITIPIRNSKL